MARVYVTRNLPTPLLDPLLERFEARVWREDRPVPRDRLLAEVENIDGLMCMLTDSVDAGLLERAPGLRVISQMAAGVDNIDLDACAKAGIAVGHTPGVLTETVADHAFALLSSVVRRLSEGEAEVRRGEWGPWAPFHLVGADLHGSTIGIVGMGLIGRAVAARARGFGMRVVYSSPRPVEDVGGEHLDLDDLLTSSDHVVVCSSLTDETVGLIGEREVRLMRPTAFLVNVARGPIVDTGAIVSALAEGSIAGVALDVTDPEPLPRDHPLLGFSNCLVVPHMGSASVATRRAMADLAVRNLVAGLTGSDMPARHPAGG